MPQDLPPAGGYEPIQYKRNIPTRGFRPAVYLGAIGVVMVYGWYKLFLGTREQKYVALRNLVLAAATAAAAPVVAVVSAISAAVIAAVVVISVAVIVIAIAYLSSKLTFDIAVSSELAREKMWGRIYLTPVLQAEADRDQVRRFYADQAREKELLGAQTSPYNSDRFFKPTYAITPQNVTK